MSGSHPIRWIAFVLISALGAFGCADTTDGTQQGETGSLSLQLVLGDGTLINTVDWQITGNGMDMSDTINVSAPGATASVEVFGLPPGADDYTVALTAVSVDGKYTCSGSEKFNVEVGKVTNVMVMLNCKRAQRFGAVRVNGEFNICAELIQATVSPLQTSVGNDIALTSQGIDEDGDPIAYSWTGDGGSIADPAAANTTYTCQEVGDHHVTVRVTDNDEVCDMATWTVLVTCVPGEGGDLCEGVVCEDTGNECTTSACNPDTGECEVSNVENGTACNEGTGTCTDGECVGAGLCDDVVCEDTGNECTTSACNPDTGECDVSNVEDGTACDEGAGVCTGGECVEAGLCDGVDCTSSNPCVQDGVCNPDTGACVPGDNEPVNTACDEDGGNVCDGAGNCVECNSAAQCPAGDECTTATCADNTCGLANAENGTACGDGGTCTDGTCEVSAELVIACDGTVSTAWRAEPELATGCTYNAADTTCTGCNLSGTLVPGGGQCAQFGAQVVRGCEVPGGVLNAQLAIDVSFTINASTPIPGEIHTEVSAVATNPALSTAAGLVTVDSADFYTDVTSAVPSTLVNSLDPSVAGQLLGYFTQGSNILDLTEFILPADTAIVPSSNPVSINYSGDFLIGLTIQASGTALNVDAASCTFNLPGAPVTCPTN